MDKPLHDRLSGMATTPARESRTHPPRASNRRLRAGPADRTRHPLHRWRRRPRHRRNHHAEASPTAPSACAPIWTRCPILETSGVPHASTNPNVMHACGHDGHTTSLLGAAALLATDPNWAGTVQLVFQPAEEGGGGAQSMIADGLFERFPMERIFAYHNWPGLEAGTVAIHDGPVMAAGNRIFFTITGHSGHAAMPHLTRDPMVACRPPAPGPAIHRFPQRGSPGQCRCHDRHHPGRHRGQPDPRPRGDARHHARLARRSARQRRTGDPPHRRWRRAHLRRHHRRADPPRHSSNQELTRRARARRGGGNRGRPDAAPRPRPGDDRRGFRLVSWPPPWRLRLDRQRTVGSAAANCTMPITISTTRSCPPRQVF